MERLTWMLAWMLRTAARSLPPGRREWAEAVRAEAGLVPAGTARGLGHRGYGRPGAHELRRGGLFHDDPRPGARRGRRRARRRRRGRPSAQATTCPLLGRRVVRPFLTLRPPPA